MGKQDSFAADRIYMLVALLLVLTWLLHSTVTGDTFFLMDVAYLSLALLCFILGMVQRAARSTTVMNFILAISCTFGVVAFLLSYVWRRRVGGGWEPEELLRLVDLATPAMVFPGLAAALFGMVRWREGESDVSRRIYVLGGLILCAGVVIQLWYGAVTQWFVPGRDPGAVFIPARELGVTIALSSSYPIALVFSLGSVCLGLLPPDTRPGTASAGTYVVGCFLLVVGAFVNAASVEWYSSDFFILGTALVIPSFVVAVFRVFVPNRRESAGAAIV